MMTRHEALYRVTLYADRDLTTRLPLVTEVERFDSAPQEFCGTDYDGDTLVEIWEFVTDRPAAMEAALDSDPAVIMWVRLDDTVVQRAAQA